jgi:hypothetical protein
MHYQIMSDHVLGLIKWHYCISGLTRCNLKIYIPLFNAKHLVLSPIERWRFTEFQKREDSKKSNLW